MLEIGAGSPHLHSKAFISWASPLVPAYSFCLTNNLQIHLSWQYSSCTESSWSFSWARCEWGVLSVLEGLRLPQLNWASHKFEHLRKCYSFGFLLLAENGGLCALSCWELPKHLAHSKTAIKQVSFNQMACFIKFLKSSLLLTYL